MTSPDPVLTPLAADEEFVVINPDPQEGADAPSDPLQAVALNSDVYEPQVHAQPAARTGQPLTHMHLSPTTAHGRAEEPPPSSRTRTRTTIQHTSVAGSEVLLPGAAHVTTDTYDPWAVRDAHNALAKGYSKHEESLRSGSILNLAEKNSLYLWILLAQGILLIALLIGVCWAIFRKPAYAKPATAEVEFYRKPEAQSPQILSFAQQFVMWYYTWNYQTTESNPARMVPFLDPAQRGQFLANFKLETGDAQTYKEHSVCEPLEVSYLGVANESKHVVQCFIQVYRGRGETTSSAKWDAISRFFILIDITEGDVSAENRGGLYVLRWIPLTERQYMSSSLAKNGVNPWDKALGIQKTPKKQTENKP